MQRNTTRGLAAAAALSAACFLPRLAPAHHSFAMFDMDSKVAIEGRIAEIQWTNPHVWVHVDVPDDDGGVTRWAVEFTSKVHLARQGFPSDAMQVGDDVTFVLSPYANGDPGGRFWTVTLPDGEVRRDPSAQREFERSQAGGSE